MDQVKLFVQSYKSYLNNETLAKLKEIAVEKADYVAEYLQGREKDALGQIQAVLKENNVSEDDFTSYYSYVTLLVLAVIPIYVGSKRAKASGKGGEPEMTKGEAAMFPIYASISLFGLYCVFSVFGKEYINYLMTLYFFLLGSHAVGHLLQPLIKCVTPGFITFMHERYDLLLTSGETDSKKEVLVDVAFDYTNIVSIVIGFLVGFWYLSTKHWLANNVFGFAFSLFGVEQLKLEGFQVGCILLSGLFIYDIFWVFGTDVMVTVATSFEAPIKLLVPKDIFENGMWGAKQFGLLGLGDIVIPGIMIALYLRFDSKINPKGFPVYFYTSLVAYVLGLVFTMVIMHVFKHAQPALLYLVPAVLGLPVILALVKGELGQLVSFEAEDNSSEESTSKSKEE